MKTVIINLLGVEGAGKTTVSKYLQAILPSYFDVVLPISWADALRLEIMLTGDCPTTTLRIVGELMKTPIVKIMSGVRQKLLDLGSLRRAEDPDYWIHAFKFQLESCQSFVKKCKSDIKIAIIVDDTRFMNEQLFLDHRTTYGCEVWDFLLFRNSVDEYLEAGRKYELVEIIGHLRARGELFDIRNPHLTHGNKPGLSAAEDVIKILHEQTNLIKPISHEMH